MGCNFCHFIKKINEEEIIKEKIQEEYKIKKKKNCLKNLKKILI